MEELQTCPAQDLATARRLRCASLGRALGRPTQPAAEPLRNCGLTEAFVFLPKAGRAGAPRASRTQRRVPVAASLGAVPDGDGSQPSR
jgi:hypothetical protein